MTTIAYDLPPRQRRRRPAGQIQQSREGNPSLVVTVVGLLLFLVASYYIMTSDFSHLDRRWLPWVSVGVIGSYTCVGLWCLICLVQSVPWPHFTMSRPGVLEAFDKPSDRLIQMPHMKGYVTRVMESGVSVSAWVIFLYYFQPIFTVVVWLLTGRWVYLHIFSTAAIEVTLDMMFTSAVFALFMMGLFWCWAKWNLYYYGALDRRKLRPPITNEEVADFFGVNEATVARVQQAKFALLDPVADQLIITVQQELS